MENEKKVRRIVMRGMPHFRLYALISFFSALLLQFVGLIPHS